jgi:hypothetical protein
MYVPKRTQQSLYFTSCNSIELSQDEKRQMILDYNNTKVSIDAIDKMTKDYN